MDKDDIAKSILSKRCSLKKSKISLRAQIDEIRHACLITKQKGKNEHNYFFIKLRALRKALIV